MPLGASRASVSERQDSRQPVHLVRQQAEAETETLTPCAVSILAVRLRFIARDKASRAGLSGLERRDHESVKTGPARGNQKRCW